MTIIITTDTQEFCVCKIFGLTLITHWGLLLCISVSKARELCNFDQKYKQKNKPSFNAILKIPCGAHRKIYVQYI